MGFYSETDQKRVRLLLKIYYYFMLVDGNLSESELECFWQLCDSIKVSKEEAEKVIKEAKQRYTDENGFVQSDKILKATKNLTKSENFYLIRSYGEIITWNLITLAYADKTISPEEEKFIKIITDYYSISSDEYFELLDTYETIMLLNKKEEWLFKTANNVNELKSMQKELADTIERLKGYIDMPLFYERTNKLNSVGIGAGTLGAGTLGAGILGVKFNNI